MSRVEFKFEGGKQLEAALLELKTATAKRLATKVLKVAATPIADAAEANAPVRSKDGEKYFTAASGERRVRRKGALKSHINVSPRLSKSQARQNKANKSDVEMHVGTRDRVGRLQEFGTAHHAPHPFIRPAWDQEGGQKALDRIREGLSVEVTKAAARAARKAAKFTKGK